MRRVLVVGAVTLFQTAGALAASEPPVEPRPGPVVLAEARMAGHGLSLPRTQSSGHVEVASLGEGLRGDPFGAQRPGTTERAAPSVGTTAQAENTDLTDEEGWMSGARWTAWLVGALGVIWFTGRRRRIP